MGRLKYCIAKTNVATQVNVLLGEKIVTKSIVEWINRRKTFATLDTAIWNKLNDKKLPMVANTQKSNGENQETKLRRYYDPRERDIKRELYGSEPLAIDAALEVTNAVTDLME